MRDELIKAAKRLNEIADLYKIGGCFTEDSYQAREEYIKQETLKTIQDLWKIMERKVTQ